MGQEAVDVAEDVVRVDWRGSRGRVLMWDQFRVAAATPLATERFSKTFVLPWSELRDTYFQALQTVALPVFELFGGMGWSDARTWLTRDAVTSLFSTVHAGLRLFPDEP